MADAQTKTVIVTGGAGYIGSHACKALAKAGYVPVCYDNLSRGHKWAVKWGPLEQGDILDKDRLGQVLNRYQPLAVMHFAALAYVGESVSNPRLYYQNNVIGTVNLLETMLFNNVSRLIFSSTCAVYGEPQSIPIIESHFKKPVNPYGNTKLTIENLLQDISMNGEIEYISLRYFNAAGADPDGEIGEDHEPETHLIPLVLQVAAGIRSHIEVYGDDYPTPDGTCIRDYIHVNDLVDSHIIALEYLLDGGKSDYFNLGTETGYSVKDIIKHAAQVTGQDIEVRQAKRRPGDPPALVADAGKIRTVLGWKPDYSNLESILSSAWAWHKHRD